MGTQDNRRLQVTGLIVSIGLLLLVLSSCQGSTNSPLPQTTESGNKLVVNKLDSLKNQFKLFRNLVIENKKEEIKIFFEFPIKSADLWYKVLDDEEIEKYKIDSLFNERDFEIYFDKIFIKSFKECMSKINVHQLFDYGTFSTEFVTYKENDYWVKSQIEATYSNNELKLVLNSTIQNKENEFEAEHTEIYLFNIINNKLKFATFYMAG